MLEDVHFNFICYDCLLYLHARKDNKPVSKPTSMNTQTTPSVSKPSTQHANALHTPSFSESLRTPSKDAIDQELIKQIISNAINDNAQATTTEINSVKTLLNQILENSKKNESQIDKLASKECHKKLTQSISQLMDKNFQEFNQIVKEKLTVETTKGTKLPGTHNKSDIQTPKSNNEALIDMFNSFEQCTWESIDFLNARYKELANRLSTGKENTSCVHLAPVEGEDESLLTPNLQKQHHNLLNTGDLTNESNTLAPNHSILMEAQSTNTKQKTEFDEFHKKCWYTWTNMVRA